MKYLALICMVITAYNAFGQTHKNSIGVYTSYPNVGLPFRLEGTPQEKWAVLGGVEYTRSLTRWLKVVGGIEYANHRIAVTKDGPTASYDVYGNLKLISLPVYIRTDLLKYFFFTFGLLIDIQLSNDITAPQQSVGITGGTGFKYDFKNTSVFIHPFYQVHGAINGLAEHGEDHLFNLGLRMGVSHSF